MTDPKAPPDGPRILRVPVVGLAEQTYMECIALIEGGAFKYLLRCPHEVRSCLVCTPIAKAHYEREEQTT